VTGKIHEIGDRISSYRCVKNGTHMIDKKQFKEFVDTRAKSAALQDRIDTYKMDTGI